MEQHSPMLKKAFREKNTMLECVSEARLCLSRTLAHWRSATLQRTTNDRKKGYIVIYIQVEQALFGLNSDNEFIVNATNEKEKTKKLLSVGFEYNCQKDDILYFRKRK
jgi:hypothetical protein